MAKSTSSSKSSTTKKNPKPTKKAQALKNKMAKKRGSSRIK